jgi:hypothetical protein
MIDTKTGQIITQGPAWPDSDPIDKAH